ncbi:Tegument antigen [Clonorchis sinensis]|uniref:Tegument antigen n=2 Tax=Clonorchis sinensis TaxID=79923 RepID=A0A8T1MSG8_CLOSI|nr:Tegument antigen [Clonorchis sinensis]
MDTYVEQFLDMDPEHKEYICTEDLQKFKQKKQLQEDFVQDWQQKFNPNNSDKITLVDVCRTRGVDIKDVRKFYGPMPDELRDVEIIECDMPLVMRVQVCKVINEGQKHCPDEPSFVQYIKKTLDRQFGKLWHVITVHGRYYSFYTYEMGYNFAFRKNDCIFLVYKTPDVEDS